MGGYRSIRIIMIVKNVFLYRKAIAWLIRSVSQIGCMRKGIYMKYKRNNHSTEYIKYFSNKYGSHCYSCALIFIYVDRFERVGERRRRKKLRITIIIMMAYTQLYPFLFQIDVIILWRNFCPTSSD